MVLDSGGSDFVRSSGPQLEQAPHPHLAGLTHNLQKTERIEQHKNNIIDLNEVMVSPFPEGRDLGKG